MVKVIQIYVQGTDKNFSYLVVGKNKEALLIDATGSVEAIEQTIRENSLKVVLQVVTHAHYDHVENVQHFVRNGVPLKSFEELKAEPEFEVAGFKVETIFLPGHTSDSVAFLIGDNLFTGDTLFVDGVGRTDLGGNQEQLVQSLKRLSALDPNLTVWPGHNYGGKKSTLGEALANSGMI